MAKLNLENASLLLIASMDNDHGDVMFHWRVDTADGQTFEHNLTGWGVGRNPQRRWKVWKLASGIFAPHWRRVSRGNQEKLEKWIVLQRNYRPNRIVEEGHGKA